MVRFLVWLAMAIADRFRWRSADFMTASAGTLSAGVGHRQSVTVRITSLMGLSMREVWCYYTSQGHSIQKWSKQVPKAAVYGVFIAAPYPA